MCMYFVERVKQDDKIERMLLKFGIIILIAARDNATNTTQYYVS